MSIDIKEREVEEVFESQPLAPIWKNCGSTLKTLDLALVWHPLEKDETSEFSECSEVEGEHLERYETKGNANIATEIFETLLATYEFPCLEKLTLRSWGPARILAELAKSKFLSLLEVSIDGVLL